MELLLTGSQVGESINLKVTVGRRVRAVLGDNQTVGAQSLPGLAREDVAFDQDLVVASAVDRLVQKVLVKVVVDVLVAETSGRSTRTLVAPVVVVKGDVEMALVNRPQRIAVTNQRALPVVMEVVPGNRDPVAATDNVALAIEIIRAEVREVARGEFVMVNPNSGAVGNGDAIVVNNSSDAEVADNDIGCICDCQACTRNLR